MPTESTSGSMLLVKLDWSGSELSALACRVVIAYLDADRDALDTLLAEAPTGVHFSVARLIGQWVDAIHHMVAPRGFGWGGELEWLHSLLQDALAPMVDTDTAAAAHLRLDKIDQARFVHHVPAAVDDLVELHLAAAYAVALASRVFEPGEFRQSMLQQLAELG